MHKVRIVKREAREATNNLVADQTESAPRMTPEMVIKSWISATRERRQGELNASLLNFQKQPKQVVSDGIRLIGEL